ncbi:DUF2589 domain-containing protein [Aliikangiella sp. G2MR2-5]|uniref:DUF2589 domain-containing protein n=1 Tax=Aliikangiella sp. G2MR2-5 TaxID=2788943 RepID=UPI0018A9C32C|nr:DUF2589 domain-containing protein [Aliikangiella sp. G2MR2-5]
MSEIADQFKGLPMGDLIGGPLQAACDAQVNLANATAAFIQKVGFMPNIGSDGKVDPSNPWGDIRTAAFKFERPKENAQPDENGDVATETVELEVPLLAVVKVPNLSIEDVNITFDMEVKSSSSVKSSTAAEASLSADISYGFGPFSAKVNISGSVSSSKESARSTDTSAKYHVDVKARDNGMPEGLARVMDMMNSSIAPKRITAPAS